MAYIVLLAIFDTLLHTARGSRDIVVFKQLEALGPQEASLLPRRTTEANNFSFVQDGRFLLQEVVVIHFDLLYTSLVDTAPMGSHFYNSVNNERGNQTWGLVDIEALDRGCRLEVVSRLELE